VEPPAGLVVLAPPAVLVEGGPETRSVLDSYAVLALLKDERAAVQVQQLAVSARWMDDG
jgi:hypothetical protein